MPVMVELKVAVIRLFKDAVKRSSCKSFRFIFLSFYKLNNTMAFTIAKLVVLRLQRYEK